MRKLLTFIDREEISRGLAERLELKEIAARIGRDPSIVSREVGRHGGRDGYRARAADVSAVRGRQRPPGRKIDRQPRLRSHVTMFLKLGWSPASIAGRLPIEHPDDHDLRVSHETIYQWVYAQPVGSLARELITLRTGRAQRRAQGSRPPKAPRIKDPVYIDERPAEVADRVVPGHWEGDLVIGKAGKTAVATLVERTSRFLMVCPLTGRDSLTVGDAVIAAYTALPATAKRSLTWDCGSEMASHKIVASQLPVYFAHPHSPWERPTNEHTNRILREYLPKGTDITSDRDYLASVAAEINDRPRKILNWKKPSEVFAEILASDASTA